MHTKFVSATRPLYKRPSQNEADFCRRFMKNSRRSTCPVLVADRWTLGRCDKVKRAKRFRIVSYGYSFGRVLRFLTGEGG